MSISISTPNKLDAPPIGNVTTTQMLTNATGTWTRPGGALSGAAAKVWGMVIDDAASASARPPLTAAQTYPTNPTGSSGSWSFPPMMGAAINDFKKLVVWLDIETEACYERDEVVFKGVMVARVADEEASVEKQAASKSKSTGG